MEGVVRIFIFLIFYVSGMAQTHPEAQSSGYFTPGAYTHHFAEVFSFTTNPACLAGATHLLCGAFTENKWTIQSLNSYQLAAAFGLGGGGCGIALYRNGDEDFNEQGFTIGYGKRLGKLDIGIEFEYQQDQAAGYESIRFISSGTGIRFRVNEKMIFGCELGLPLSGMTGKLNPERAPLFYRMGFGYDLLSDVSLTWQIEKQSGQPLAISGYLQYRYSDHFSFLFGINNSSHSVSFRTGWKKNGLDIQLCLLFEPLLGFSPALAVLWENQNKKE
jgi:hypothetical protein